MIRRSPAVLASLLAAPFLVSCSGSAGLDDTWTVEEALAELPAVDGGDVLTVRTGDVERAAEVAGADPGDPDFLEQVALELALPVPVTSSSRTSPGFELSEVQSFTSLQAGGDVLDVYRFADGEPAEDEVPSGLERAAEDDRIALASESSLLDRWRDRDETLDEDDALGPLAEALDDAGDGDLYSAALLGGFEDRAVTAVGVGQGEADGDPFELAVYAVADDADVDDVVAQVERAWSEAGDADGPIALEDVDTDGDVVVARLRPDQPGATYRALLLTQEVALPE